MKKLVLAAAALDKLAAQGRRRRRRDRDTARTAPPALTGWDNRGDDPCVSASRPAPTGGISRAAGAGHRALYGLLGVIALGAVAFLGLKRVEPPQLDLVMPTHARVGEVVILTGTGFSTRPERNLVYVGDFAARVLEAQRTRLLVEVPDMSLDTGQSALVRVAVGSNQTTSLNLTVEATLEPEPGSDTPEDDDGAAPTPRPRVPSPRS